MYPIRAMTIAPIITPVQFKTRCYHCLYANHLTYFQPPKLRMTVTGSLTMMRVMMSMTAQMPRKMVTLRTMAWMKTTSYSVRLAFLFITLILIMTLRHPDRSVPPINPLMARSPRFNINLLSSSPPLYNVFLYDDM